MYNFWFDIGGLAILAIIAILMRMKNSLRIESTAIFKGVLICCMLSTTSDLISGIISNHLPEWLGIMPIWAIEANNYLYFITHSACGFLYLLYILVSLNINVRNSSFSYPLVIPYAIILVALLLNLVLNWMFTIDSEGNYHRGPMILIVYLMTACYLAVGFVLLFRYGHTIAHGKLFAMVAFIVLTITGIVTQMIMPYLLIENYCTDLCLLFVYLTMYRPEEITDEPTGLLNASAFSQIVDTHLARKNPFSLIFFSISDSIYLRETLGEKLIGKLQEQITTFLSGFREADIFHLDESRYCLLYPSHTQMIESKALLAIVKRFERHWMIGEEAIDMTPKILIINYPEDLLSKTELFDMMDACAIDTGKQRVVRQRDLDIQRVRWTKEIDRISRTCVTDNSLEVVYQPVYNVRQKHFTTAEALVRLKDPVLGRIPPDELVSIAEKNGSIVQIDNYVLGEVCVFLHDHADPEEGININLSMVECVQDNLVERLCDVTSRHGIPNKNVRLELTETISDTFPEKARRNFQALRKVGFIICMDDYGQGYSNLDRLVSMPLDIIKLDKEFITRSEGDPKTTLSMKMLIRTMKKMGKTILVEGVETKEQADLAISMDCDYIQGYYYSKPLSKTDFIALLESQDAASSKNI